MPVSSTGNRGWQVRLNETLREAPTASQKAELSVRRARAVRAYLIASGIAAGRVKAVGNAYATVLPLGEIDEAVLATMRTVRTDAAER